MYCDTDSALYATGDKLGSPDFATGPLLGDLTNELEEFGKNAFITTIVSVGPKFYTYDVKKLTGLLNTSVKLKVLP